MSDIQMSFATMLQQTLTALMRQKQSVLVDRIVQCFLIIMEGGHFLEFVRIPQIEDMIQVTILCCTLNLVSTCNT